MYKLKDTLVVCVLFIGVAAMYTGFSTVNQRIDEAVYGFEDIANNLQDQYLALEARADIQARTLGGMMDRIRRHRNCLEELYKEFDLSVLDSCGIITDGHGHGSCVAIGEDLVLTAGHCLGHEGSWIEIGGRKYEIVEEWKSDRFDVGFVRVKSRLSFVELGLMPQILDAVYVVGAPSNSAFVNTVSKGVVTKLGLNWYKHKNALVVDAANYFGNSGGPIFDEDGKVIGILVAGPDRTDSIGVCVPVCQIRSALRTYLSK